VDQLGILFRLFSGIILLYALNNLYLIWSTGKYRKEAVYPLDSFPKVSVQLPIYNEKEVISRLIDKVSGMNWPRDSLEVLILDDSDDETRSLIDEKVAQSEANIRVLRRENRQGFKAGALQNGLLQTDSKYIAIFDADFLPEADFLNQVIPVLEHDESIGLVQTRWGHVNRDYNKLTKAISLALDWHHHIEQAGRNASKLFINFNGSCGVIRREALLEAGGWSADTLSEDLDISYRIQLRHWNAVYKREVVVPGEVPPSINDYKEQQRRWARGSIQCSRMLLGKVLGSDIGLKQKVQAVLHLNSYSVYLWTILLLLLSVPSLILEKATNEIINRSLGYIGVLGIISQIAMFGVLWRTRQSSLIKFSEDFLFLFLTSLGMSMECSLAVIRGLLSKGGAFLRTPKYNITNKEKPIKGRETTQNVTPEIIMAIYSLIGVIIAASIQNWGMLIYLSLHLTGFTTLILLSLKPSLF
jgi:cellulose synthase/poly-beta-1,6-N-acetylglucosamine synthase-like glycosyltransferase